VTVAGTRTFAGSPSFSYSQSPVSPAVGGSLSECGTDTTASSSVGSTYHVLVASCTGLTTDGNHQISYTDGGSTVTKASSTTTVSCPACVIYAGLALTPCSVSITGAGGLSLPATPAYTNNINPGMATASYTYAGDANHYGSSGSKTFQILYSSEPCLGSPGRDVLQPINRDAPSTTSAFKKGSTASQVPGLRFLWTLDWHGGCRDILRVGEEAQRDGFGRTCDRRHRLHDA
jgi:hypothetical protein